MGTTAMTNIIDIGYKEFLPVFDGFSEGVIIVDRTGTIIYYNRAMGDIDELAPEDAIGLKIVDVYDLSEEKSIVMQCLNSRRPIIDRALLYRTRRGKVANTIHTVFPLFKHQRIEGAICLVREYSVLEDTISAISLPLPQPSRPNDTRFDFGSMVGASIDFLRAVNTAKIAANSPSPVMLHGETGTGKELFAQAIHNASDRSAGRYTAVNCAAIPENLLEGILFGTSKGAFTGAKNKLGLFESTSGGTVFLDELNAMPIGLQAKILRVIQERKVRRLGSLQETEIDLKIISSVDREPHLAISENHLRPDLYYRLGVVFIPIPPLRERKEDIELLARHFVVKHSRVLNRHVTGISDDVLSLFQGYDWPGNVRELEHIIEGAINLVVSSDTIERRHLQAHPNTWRRLKRQQEKVAESATAPLLEEKRGEDRTIDRPRGLKAAQAEQERATLSAALADHGGNVTRAAKSVGISRQLFSYKMKKHGIQRVRRRS
jgi:arginine utilization regulatory protein